MKNLIALLLLLLASSVVSAQVPDAAAREALASLPESQGVLFVNARRITNEALPRVVPAARLRAAFDDAKKQTTIDLREIEFVVVGARFDGDAARPNAPDFGVLIRGGFNADAMLSFFRMGAQGKFREERRGAKTITIFQIDSDGEAKKGAAPASPEASPSASPKTDPFALPTDLAAVSLDANSVLVGTIPYVTSAVDARDGGGTRIKSELVDLALRDTDALVSLAATLPASVSKYLDSGKGSPNMLVNDEMKRLLDSVRHAQASLNMTPARFGFQTVLRADTPEDARAISGLVSVGVNSLTEELAKKSGGRKALRLTAGDRRMLELIRSLTNVVADRDVTLGVGVSQGTVAGFVSDMTGPPAKAPAKPVRRARAAGARRKA
ncbi:MAG: hypothetical protein LC785_03795 [Acidobacteria bacterium]|nr:hypothetical protein [Acidobacteriota bacterium]MCA1641106.1 hypothetical protein [Acidobacteriota bacterium]